LMDILCVTAGEDALIPARPRTSKTTAANDEPRMNAQWNL
jgi:hypothetical protein